MNLTEALMIVATLIAVIQPISGRSKLSRISSKESVSILYTFISCSGWLSLFLLLMHVLTSNKTLQTVSLYVILVCVLCVLIMSIVLEFIRRLNLVSLDDREDDLFRNLVAK